MSFGISAATWAAIAAAGVGAYSAYSSNKNAKASLAQQEKAQRKAEQNAQAQATSAEEASNAANMKMPDTAAMMSSAMLSGKAGQSGTMLTGPQGVKKDKLGLQKNTLLGS